MSKIQIDLKLPIVRPDCFFINECEACPLMSAGQIDWCNYYDKRIDKPDIKPEFCTVSKIIVEA